MQRLDPPGVGARTLKECLLLQLLPGMPYYEELRTLIDEPPGRPGEQSPAADLEEDRLLDRKDPGSLARAAQAQAEAGRRLQRVDRAERDARRVRRTQRRRQVRDSARRRRSCRRCTSARYYRKLLRDESTNAETREYIKRKINSAQWLIESIEQRRSTLTRVSQAIVDHQTKFLDDGPEYIEPLKMQQIADKVGVHVTTVSRAVDDKWIQTPRGIFPLKRFFVGGTTRGRRRRSRLGPRADQAARNHRQRRQEAAALGRRDRRRAGKAGITVARRTVTKYRKAMNIPSSPRPPRLVEGREVDDVARMHRLSSLATSHRRDFRSSRTQDQDAIATLILARDCATKWLGCRRSPILRMSFRRMAIKCAKTFDADAYANWESMSFELALDRRLRRLLRAAARFRSKLKPARTIVSWSSNPRHPSLHFMRIHND